jgi:hypothetical protein
MWIKNSFFCIRKEFMQLKFAIFVKIAEINRNIIIQFNFTLLFILLRIVDKK